MRVADFFCGGGGFSEGFRQAGFEIVFAVDKWAPAVNTYKGNKPGANVIQDDVIRISNLPDDEFEALVPDSEVIIGSPPCQSFSHSNKSGNADKELGIKLIEAYASLISLQSEIGFFLRNNRVMVVLDEAHKAKNSSGGIIAQAVLDMSRYSKARIVLTGTPAPNGYEDIYNMFKFIWPNKNVLGFEVNQLRDITATGDTARVTRLIDNISPYFIRIRKSDLNIPPATVHPPVFVPMGPLQQRIYVENFRVLPT